MLGALGMVAVGAVVVLFLVMPPDRRRGLGGLLGVAVLVLAVTSAAPPFVRTAAQFGSIAVMLAGSWTGSRERTGPSTGIVALLGAHAAATVFAIATGSGLGLATVVPLLAVAVAAVVCFRGFGAADLRLFLGGVVWLAGLEGVLGILEYLTTQQPIPWGRPPREDGRVLVLRNTLLPASPPRVAGSLGHPIPYGTVLGLAVLAVVGRWRSTSAVVRWVVLPVVLTGLLLSGSRSVVLGVVAGVVVLVWTAAGRGRVVRVFALVAGGVVGAVVLGRAIAAMVGHLLTTGSFTNRAGAIESVPELLARPLFQALFGTGYGSELDYYRRGLFAQNGFFVIDNQLVTTLTTVGVVGVVIAVGFFVVGWRRGGRVRRAWLVLFAVMLFSFDYFGWPAVFTLLMATVAWPAAPAAPAAAPAAARR